MGWSSTFEPALVQSFCHLQTTKTLCGERWPCSDLSRGTLCMLPAVFPHASFLKAAEKSAFYLKNFTEGSAGIERVRSCAEARWKILLGVA